MEGANSLALELLEFLQHLGPAVRRRALLGVMSRRIACVTLTAAAVDDLASPPVSNHGGRTWLRSVSVSHPVLSTGCQWHVCAPVLEVRSEQYLTWTGT
jgi:hypothetical protein